MRVIGVGLGRTGTLSTKVALERLGFAPCHHMFEVMAQPHLAEKWSRVLSGQRPPWDEVFAGYDATVDWPAAAYWKELVDAYPDAKVLLTVREPNKWYDSMRATILEQVYGDHSGLRDRLLMQAFSIVRPAQARLVSLLPTMVEGIFDGDQPPTREMAVELFERHVRDVQSYVPADRLLTFEVKQGWEPLCDFLDVPVPDEEFPRVNDAGAFHQIGTKVLFGDRSPAKLAGAAGLAAAVAVLAILLTRRRKSPSRR